MDPAYELLNPEREGASAPKAQSSSLKIHAFCVRFLRFFCLQSTSKDQSPNTFLQRGETRDQHRRLRYQRSRSDSGVFLSADPRIPLPLVSMIAAGLRAISFP